VTWANAGVAAVKVKRRISAKITLNFFTIPFFPLLYFQTRYEEEEKIDLC
jgi:hypothetical protein